MLASSVLVLSSCEAEDNDTNNDQTTTNQTGSSVTGDIQTYTIDATSSDNKVYFNLDEGKTVTADQAWHLSFRTTSINSNSTIVNGEVSGTVVALLDPKSALYNDTGAAIADQFMALDAQVEEQVLTEDMDLTAMQFSGEQQVAAVDNSWYSYDFTTHQVTANSDQWYIVADADAKNFTKFHVHELTQLDRVINATFASYVQLEGWNKPKNSIKKK